ncbi:hypothetical protein EDD18DRAFT_79782 [Armillaria luteobubalina]|uniref:Uncharacterized protein n=1 Tax=Armillaria luteobubalina TaxID=153913 RepID=A0AA39Q8F3_9AGAR|nr:hypothetical protein EDD18DRAFT_79782 [Armillaria luteobubalina]
MIGSLFVSTMPTPSLDANFVFPRNANGKWTVSPEFGDALLHAMRERPSTRIPSIVELPPSKRPQLVAPSLESRRLTMKTRIAVREKTPHRFEVVPLRDVHRRAPSPMFKQVTPLANARVKLRSVNVEATARNTKATRRVSVVAKGFMQPTRGRENSKLPQPPVIRQARIPRGKNIQPQPTALHAKSASLSSLHPANSPTRHSYGRSEDIRCQSQIPYSLKRRAIYTQTLFIPKLAATVEEESDKTLVEDVRSLAFSMLSDYSQDSFQVVPKYHHPIVVELIAAIDLAIGEWEKIV